MNQPHTDEAGPESAAAHPAAMPPPQGGPYPYPVSKPMNNLALVALILSVSGIGIGGIICGHIARKQIRENPHQDGDTLALAGLIVGYCATVLVVLFIAAYVAFIIFMINHTPTV